MNRTEETFAKELQKEILLNEKLKAKLLGTVAAIMFASFASLLLLFSSFFEETFHSLVPFYIMLGMLALLGIREFNIRLIITKVLKSERHVRDIFRYVNVFFEISVPTIILITLLFYYNSLFILSTPVVLFYFVILILTTLSLEFKISVFAGVTACIEYGIVVYFAITSSEQLENMPALNQPFIYVGKCIALLIGGFMSGIVANQLKKRIYSTYKSLYEKNRIAGLFSQQVSQEIADELQKEESELQSKRKHVAIMFLDIRGFSKFSEHKQPEDIVAYQNAVFGFMIEAVNKHHGIVNQILGDGFMATFGAPVSIGNNSDNAVSAAFEIISSLDAKNKSGEISLTNIGIGIHSGDVIAGNVGTEARKQYSISGSTVIWASRIEQLNKQFNSQILISEEVLNELTITDNNAIALGEAEVKGREQPINIFKLA